MNTHTNSYFTSRDILIVDDTPSNLQLLSALLSQEGYEVYCATSGAIALQTAQSNPPDLILLDVMMPGMDGYEVCRWLKANPSLAEVPVIFISALDAISQWEKVVAAGGVDYITKPFKIQDVLTKVQQALVGSVWD